MQRDYLKKQVIFTILGILRVLVGINMRKITEKVAIIAQICITLVFVITTMLSVTNVIPWNDDNTNSVLITLLLIMAIIYGLLSAYIIYVNFAERENIRQILLFCDSESATRANAKVIRNIVRSCAKKVGGVRVKKIKMRLDETHGIVVTLKVDVSTHNVSQSIDKLRCLIADAFKNTLGLSFNSINFEIRRLKSRYKPDVEKAEKLAKTLTQQRELSADIYEQPFHNSPMEQSSPNARKNDDENESNISEEDAQAVEEIREQLNENGQNATIDSQSDAQIDDEE